MFLEAEFKSLHSTFPKWKNFYSKIKEYDFKSPLKVKREKQ